MSDGKRVIRTLPWLQARSKPALSGEHREQLVDLAGTMTPNGAYDAACEKMYLATGNMTQAEELAKACRWLAVIRRDHGKDAFELSVLPKNEKRPRPIGTGKKGSKNG